MAKVGVIGAGAWGTALAVTAARANNDVLIWARESDLVNEINNAHTNSLYLPAAVLPETIRATDSMQELLAFAEVVLLVAPAQYTRSTLELMKPYLKKDVPLVLCAKGLELSTGLLLTEVAHEIMPEATLAVLSGPCFAIEVAQGKPTAATIASNTPGVARRLAEVMGSSYFRPYFSDDIIAPEVCGAIKNVIAIAAGISEGCGFGDNARAALITRGLNEMTRFAKALGGHKTTVLGLSGVGDLVLTACSTQSRNYSFGLAVGKSGSAAQILASSKTTTEGVPTSAAVMQRAREMDIDMPITAAVNAILHHGLSVSDILTGLLARPFKSESDSF